MTDLDHEYHQADHVDTLVAEHGWTPEVEYLDEPRSPRGELVNVS